jgi:hypothetical protein
MLRGGADEYQLVDARRREQRHLLRDLAAERVADDAGALQIEWSMRASTSPAMSPTEYP